ncbi:hypothetical protein BU23DRAFT_602157 [Bimuria novae-zelandiae CBS 107.79]|uniref:Uncharacterized protein n=1 Tax=Bimuria novae-zelandiae CBS 107.79 TaxID=1447943 RepID=A0A6A5V5I0_9PLEO|nr:hypothetical protein BU23DRAFT_602157 [Bimuria novae-zelandiae CBS 107.79]
MSMPRHHNNMSTLSCLCTSCRSSHNTTSACRHHFTSPPPSYQRMVTSHYGNIPSTCQHGPWSRAWSTLWYHCGGWHKLAGTAAELRSETRMTSD